MQTKPGDRFNWAIKIMNVLPEDKILEIGCGTGISIESIASNLTKGKITAIDRSKTMIEKATKRNLLYIKSKKAEVIHCNLLQLTKRVTNNKVFCFNVNLFWTKKSIKKEADILKKIISPKGLLFIFYGPLFGDGLSKIRTPLIKSLAAEKLNVIDIIHDKTINCCCFISTVVE